MLGRLREQRSWPDVDAIAITHWHLDHWGDLVPWVWGRAVRPLARDIEETWCRISRRGAEMLEGIGARLRVSGHAPRARSDLNEYAVGGEPFETAGFEVTAERDSSTTSQPRGLRLPGLRQRSRTRLLGDSGPSDAVAVDRAQDADLFGVCEATLLAP